MQQIWSLWGSGSAFFFLQVNAAKGEAYYGTSGYCADIPCREVSRCNAGGLLFAATDIKGFLSSLHRLRSQTQRKREEEEEEAVGGMH